MSSLPPSSAAAPPPRPSKPRLVVTGGAGLLGFHLRALAHGHPEWQVVAVDRQRFHDDLQLDACLRGAAAVVHLAGMNRGEETVLEATNLLLTERLLARLEVVGATPYLLFASSTHRDRDTAYGRAKRRCGEKMASWSAARGLPFCELVLPNVFGEFGKPFHNSAISTFCHQLAHGETPQLLQDQVLEWIHAQAVAARVLVALASRESGLVRVAGFPLAVSAVLDRLRAIDAFYRQGQLPHYASPLDRDLFNTYRSYWPLVARSLEKRQDPRGTLVELVQSHQGGQAFFSTTQPGMTRGGHFHRHKFERFLVLSGAARIRLRRLFSPQILALQVQGDQPAYVDIPTFFTHDLTNLGQDPLVTLFWADEIFDPQRPDTLAESLETGFDPALPGEPA